LADARDLAVETKASDQGPRRKENET